MKKYIIILLLLLPSLCFGASTAATIMGKAPSAISTIAGKAISAIATVDGVTVAASSCTTESTPIYTSSYAVAYSVGQAAANYYRGNIIVLAGSKTYCKFAFNIGVTGTTQAYSLTARVWSLSTGNLDTELRASSAVAISWGWTNAVVTFTLSSPVTLSAGTYAVTLDMGTVDGTNYAIPGGTGDAVSNITWARWGSDKAQTSTGTGALYFIPYE